MARARETLHRAPAIRTRQHEGSGTRHLRPRMAASAHAGADFPVAFSSNSALAVPLGPWVPHHHQQAVIMVQIVR